MKVFQLFLGIRGEGITAFLAESKLVESMTFRTDDTASWTTTFGAICSVARKWCSAERANIIFDIPAAIFAIIGTLRKHRTANRA